MGVDLERLQQLIDKAPPGSMVVVAPDVYDQLAAHWSAVGAPKGQFMGIEIRRSPALRPGQGGIMAPHAGIPMGGFATKFLAKSGPTLDPPPVVAPPVVVAAPEPPPPLPEPELPAWRPQGPRQRIVDT